MAKFKIGDRIVFGRCKRNKGMHDITVGKIYEVVKNELPYASTKLAFKDDVGDVNCNGLFKEEYKIGEGFKATKIVGE